MDIHEVESANFLNELKIFIEIADQRFRLGSLRNFICVGCMVLWPKIFNPSYKHNMSVHLSRTYMNWTMDSS